MKKLLLTSISIAMFSASAFAQTSSYMSAVKPYVSLKAGASLLQVDEIKVKGLKSLTRDVSKKVGFFSPAIGVTSPCNTFRAEFEYTYRWKGNTKAFFMDADTLYEVEAKPKTQSYMLNGYYEIPLTGQMKPYLNAGLGLSHIKIGGEKDNNFTFGIGVGATYEFQEGLAVDYGYRYVDMGKFEKKHKLTNEKLKTEVSSHELYVGLRYAF